MSHNYLFDMYRYLAERMEVASSGAQATGEDDGDSAFTAGRVDALSDIRDYLESQLHRKLPRRLQKKTAADGPHGNCRC